MKALYKYIEENNDEDVKDYNLNFLTSLIGQINGQFEFLTGEAYANILKEIEVINANKDYTEEDLKDEMFDYLIRLKSDVLKPQFRRI